MNGAHPQDVTALYRSKLRTPREAAGLLAASDTMAVPLATGQPAVFLAALGERDDWSDLVCFGGLLIEPYQLLQRAGVRFTSGFLGPIERMMISAGLAVDYLPADFLGWDRYARVAAPRVLASAVAPMDERGFFSFGLHAGATYESVRTAAQDPNRLAIVEVVRDMPHVFGFGKYGGNRIHVSEVDCIIESDRSAFVLPNIPITDADERIAAGARA